MFVYSLLLARSVNVDVTNKLVPLLTVKENCNVVLGTGEVVVVFEKLILGITA
jgi:hypothetical protein